MGVQGCQTAEKYAEEAAASAAGFEAYKYRPALGPAEDLRTVELIRGAVGSVGFAWMPRLVENGETVPTHRPL